jgi:serine/threonine protein kinase
VLCFEVRLTSPASVRRHPRYRDGLSSENVKSSMPRSDSNYADQKTDIFALGSTIYYMMTGHEPFPELNPLDDNDEAEIVTRYQLRQFPRSCLEQLHQALKSLLSWMWRTRHHSTSSHSWPLCLRLYKWKLPRKYYGTWRAVSL